ncbi:amino acid adenylation domain-containing protein [Verminephrobacter aporrectodeae subsp. tuberculatae]|uniref:non-ribosomal peptide synthetase n=1 Tax=Verminephrobacter aporrectodeae TaxID=1110389 RepID=UPI00224490A7|nr:non-ribosomal peptide synthetase [Verminephrobacter aporrectodeae]MCW8199468.1 amino acid adenylation domain-containing protein [Verminephrobacter aporrectodeae subsp. tuberculatae]
MALTELIEELKERQIRLGLSGDRLTVNAPTGTLDDALKAMLRLHRDDLIVLLRSNQRAGVTEELRLVADPAARHQPFPLTDVQHAYWLGRSADLPLGGVSTHMYMVFERRGLDPQRLDQAWSRVVQRHDMLRVVIQPDGRQKTLADPPAWHIPVTDLRNALSDVIAATLGVLQDELSHQVIPCDRFPLFDIRVALLADGLVRTYLSFDALVTDVSGLDLMLSDWLSLYEDPGFEFQPLTLSFRDYVLAEEEERRGGGTQSAKDYWYGRLDTLPPAPQLPVARSFDEIRPSHFVRRRIRVEPEAWARFRKRAIAAGHSPATGLLAAYAEILGRWSQEADFTVNVTLCNRRGEHAEIASLLGDFTSLTLLEVHQRPNESFLERLHKIGHQLSCDLDHRGISGVEVLRELNRRTGQPPGSASMPVIFTSALGMAKGGGLSAAARLLGEETDGLTQTPQIILDNQVFERDGALLVNWDAVQEAFPPGVLDRMMDAYSVLLDSLSGVDDRWTFPTAPPVGAALLAANATEAPLPRFLLHQPFLARAEATPDALALLGHRRLTYGDLYREAAATAAWLCAQGIRPGDMVPVLLDKGVEQMVAVLGVLLAGGSYVPIDPHQPAIRRSRILAHLAARVVLAAPAQATALGQETGLLVGPVGSDPHDSPVNFPMEHLALPSPGKYPVHRTDTDLAYVIFTSGSTGDPKGVMIDHRGAWNTIADVNNRYGIGCSDRVFALSALNFDLSVYDLFGPLAVGGALVIPEPQEIKEPSAWLERMSTEGVTLWNSVPALMRMLVDHLDQHPDAKLPALRRILLSGDWVPLSLPDRIRRLWPQAGITSLGGATEASIWSIAYEIDEVAADWPSVPYGRALANQGMHVLNRQLEPAPVGVAGGIFISGTGLALGYLGDTEKTNRHFIVHPGTGQRLYDTGDIGCWLEDASIRFLGRRDSQVKINGHRIELGEIEAALMAVGGDRLAAAVVDAVALSDTSAPGAARALVSWIVPADPTLCDPEKAEDMPTSALARFAEQAHAEGVDLQPTGGDAPLLPAITVAVTDEMARIAFRHAHHNERTVSGTSVELPGRIDPDDENAVRSHGARRSHRRFASNLLSMDQLGHWLACAQGVSLRGSILPKYRYASAGSLYPVQIHLLVRDGVVGGLSGGAYYYHPRCHALMRIGDAVIDPRHFDGSNAGVVEGVGVLLVLVNDRDAIEPLYGPFAHDFGLIETGALAHLLSETATVHGIGCCSLGRMADAPVRAMLALRPGQMVTHLLAAGTALEEYPQTDVARSPQSRRQTFEEELRRRLAERLPEHMLPEHLLLLDRLPLTANGKIDRKALPHPRIATGSHARERIAPRTTVEWQLQRLWGDALGVPDIGVHDNFFQLGADSVTAVSLVSQIESMLGSTLPVSLLLREPTIARLANIFEQQSPAAAGANRLLRLRNGSDGSFPKPPLFLVHPVGGNLLCYRTLIEGLPTDRAIHGFYPPTLHGGPAYESIEAMAADYLRAVKQVQTEGPYHLAAWSFGGLVAWELARQLRASGDVVAPLHLIDSHPPSHDRTDLTDAELLAELIRDFSRLIGHQMNVEAQMLQSADNTGRLDETLDLLADRLGFDRGSAMLRHLFATHRSHMTNKHAYTPAAMAQPVVLYRASELLAQWQQATGRAAEVLHGRYLGWDRFAPDIRVIDCAGDHYTLLQGRHGADLARAMADALARGESAPP